MNIKGHPLGGWYTDLGHGIGTAARGIVSIASDVRGDQTVQGSSPINYANYLVYGGLAAFAAYMLVKK